MKFRIVGGALAAIISLPVTGSAAEMRWPMTNNTAYEVRVKFYSRARNLVWPSASTSFVLRPRQRDVLAISCRAGDYICYGAAYTTNLDRHWGVGFYGNQGCSSCCHHCMNGTVGGYRLNP